MRTHDGSIEDAIAAAKRRAAELSHVLDMQGLVALLAHVLYNELVLKSMVDKSGFPSFTEDQIFAIILSGMPEVEHVELGSDTINVSESDPSSGRSARAGD